MYAVFVHWIVVLSFPHRLFLNNFEQYFTEYVYISKKWISTDGWNKCPEPYCCVSQIQDIFTMSAQWNKQTSSLEIERERAMKFTRVEQAIMRWIYFPISVWDPWAPTYHQRSESNDGTSVVESIQRALAVSPISLFGHTQNMNKYFVLIRMLSTFFVDELAEGVCVFVVVLFVSFGALLHLAIPFTTGT